MANVRSVNGVLTPAGLSTFGRQLEWRQNRTATPDGFKRGAILSGNSSPTPGTAYNGPTAVLRSAGKLDYTQLPNGCALDLSLDPGLLSGNDGLHALCALIKGSLETGVFLVQVNVADPALLRRAQEHPEQFPELTVRISGWSARFVSLGRHWQDMVIERLEQNGRYAPPPMVIPVEEVL
jgi:formate C-acetyltransferase